MIKEITLKDGRNGVIRYANSNDAKHIVKKMERMIRDENFLEEEEGTVNDVEEEQKEISKIKREGSLYAVIDVDEEIAGVLILKRGKLKMNHHTVDVRVWITNDFRGQGLGSLLMDYGINWSMENKVEKICLDVFDNNPNAIKMYKKFGFVEEGRRENQYILEEQYVDEVFMSKFLTY